MTGTPVIRVVAGSAAEHVEGEEASQARHVIPLIGTGRCLFERWP